MTLRRTNAQTELWAARVALALLLAAAATMLALRPDPRDELRTADALLAAGRYHDALAAYGALALRFPEDAPTRLRLGMLHVVRGEAPPASRELARAIGLGLHAGDADLARLYQGQMELAAGRPAEARAAWALIPSGARLHGARLALEAEARLAAGDYGAAEGSYRGALAAGLPPGWAAAARTRLAALRASSDASGALAELALIDGGGHWPGAYLLAPLTPRPSPTAEQLAAALAEPPERRRQLLGQLYVAGGLYALADGQFGAAQASVDAQVYAAYARLAAGDPAASVRRLEALAAAQADPALQPLLALAYLRSGQADAALAQIEAARRLAPRDPRIELAMGQWYITRREYPLAAAAYRRAHELAPPAERGGYALALARFHLDTTLDACTAGRPPAEEAARLTPQSPAAWSALAEARLVCADAPAARAAAERAMALDPASPAAAYVLGRALALSGELDAAREALVRAADLAPASIWRRRAEAQLAILGLT